MLPIPENVSARFSRILEQRAIPEPSRVYYGKWLRYFLDFCKKYPPPADKSEQVRLFIEKLKSKKQSPQQCEQSAHAVSLFFESQQTKTRPHPTPVTAKPPRPARLSKQRPKARKTGRNVYASSGLATMSTAHTAEPSFSSNSPGGKRFNEWRCLKKTKSPAWDQVIEKLDAEIKVRHYSRKTLQTYANWARKFQRFLHDKPPEKLSSLDVKEYLTHLAVKCSVASSTQNQAFNALLFLFRHVLKKDFGD